LQREIGAEIGGELVFQACTGDVHLDIAAVEIAVAEQRPVEAFQRRAIKRGNAAVGKAAIIVVGIGQDQLGLLAQICGQRRAETDEAASEEIAVIGEFLVCGVHAQCRTVAQRLVDVGAQRKSAPGIYAGIGSDELFGQLSALGDTVDRPAARAAAKDQCVCALENFDPFDIIERAEILKIVAQPIDVEIGGGLLSANEHFVTVAFAGLERDAGNVPQCVIQRSDALVVELVFGQHADRLRHIDQRGRGLGSARTVINAISLAFTGDHDLAPKIIAIFRRIAGYGGGRHYRSDAGNQERGAKGRESIHVRTFLRIVISGSGSYCD